MKKHNRLILAFAVVALGGIGVARPAHAEAQLICGPVCVNMCGEIGYCGNNCTDAGYCVYERSCPSGIAECCGAGC
jgi:hypothetical protein